MRSPLRRVLVLVATCRALVPSRPAGRSAGRSAGGRIRAAAPRTRVVTRICPLAPLAPVWLVGRGAIEARRNFFPDAEPWPRAWEESDLWLVNSLKFGGDADAGDAKCPVPEEARQGARRPPGTE